MLAFSFSTKVCSKYKNSLLLSINVKCLNISEQQQNQIRMGGGMSVLAEQEGLSDCPVQGAAGGGLVLLVPSGG